jgi:geranylgeranyl reductase family protein
MGRSPSPADHIWRTDLLIIGAGPAGSSAAVEASRRGLSVVVVDKARFPRDKCCGDGLTTGALRALDELGFDPGRVPSYVEVTDVRLRAPGGRMVHLPLPPGPGSFAAVCRRSELDEALVDLARRSGATVVEGHELTAVAEDGQRVRATAGGIDFEAPFAIAADGMWSPTRKLLGLAADGYHGEWHAFRQYFTGVSDAASRDLIVWFEPDLLPGYAWSFPVGGGVANVGFGIQRGRGPTTRDMGNLWPDLLARPHIRSWLGSRSEPEGPHRAWPIPARLGSSPLVAGRVLFAGDAATATDPMTGEGIGQALDSGRTAATVVADAIRDQSPAAAELAGGRYRSILDRTMIRDHRMAAALTWVLARRRLTELAFRAVDLTSWTRRHFARWLFEDYPRAIVVTPGRWHRRMFRSDGVRFRTPSDEPVTGPST